MRKEESEVLAAAVVEQVGEGIEESVVGDHEWVTRGTVRTLVDVPSHGHAVSLFNLLHLPIRVSSPRLPLEFVGLGPEATIKAFLFAFIANNERASSVVDWERNHNRRYDALGEDSVVHGASVGAGRVDVELVPNSEQVVSLG